jgi:hypothetical protein
MNPVTLGFARHYEPVSLSEFKRNRFLCSPMPELKPCRTERQARYGWAISKARLVVAMPSEAIAAIPIEIKQNCIIRCAGNFLRPFAQQLNNRRKRCRSMMDTAVCVIRIAEPRRHPRDRHLAAEQARSSIRHGTLSARHAAICGHSNAPSVSIE